MQRVSPRDVSTCWNSTFDMLEFALSYREALDNLTGILLKSPVQSGFVAQKNKTETETGPDVS